MNKLLLGDFRGEGEHTDTSTVEVASGLVELEPGGINLNEAVTGAVKRDDVPSSEVMGSTQSTAFVFSPVGGRQSSLFLIDHIDDNGSVLGELIAHYTHLLSSGYRATRWEHLEFGIDELTPSGKWKYIPRRTPDVNETLAQRFDLPKETQRTLAKNESHLTRSTLARNETIAPDVQQQLARDEEWCVREALASNIKITIETQLRLVGDESWWVRAALARNPTIADTVRLRLAEDKSAGVLAALREFAQGSSRGL